MEVKIDLSKVNEKSMTNIIQTNKDTINKSIETGSVIIVTETISKLFQDAGISTPASNRLIANVRKSRNATEACFKIWNSCLAGTGNAVIR